MNGTDLIQVSRELRQGWSHVPREKNPALLYLAGLKPSGQSSARSQLQKIATTFGYGGDNWESMMPWHCLEARHIKVIKAALMSQDPAPAPSTVNFILSVLRGVLREAFETGLVDGETWERIRLVRGEKGSRLPAGRHLADRELSTLLGVCDDGTLLGVRDGAIIALMYGAGLRRASIASLQVSNLDLADGWIRLIVKGNKEHKIPLPHGTVTAIQDWLESRGLHDGFVFHQILKNGRILKNKGMSSQAIYKVMQRRATLGGIAKTSPHDMRRTYITNVLEKTGDLSVAQDLAGHSNPATTKLYDRRGEKVRRDAVDLLYVPYSPKKNPSKP